MAEAAGEVVRWIDEDAGAALDFISPVGGALGARGQKGLADPCERELGQEGTKHEVEVAGSARDTRFVSFGRLSARSAAAIHPRACGLVAASCTSAPGRNHWQNYEGIQYKDYEKNQQQPGQAN